MMHWFINAMNIKNYYNGEVNYSEKYYICPECGEPIYSDDWSDGDLTEVLCPICGLD